MTLHLVKLCVGISSVEELENWYAEAKAFGLRAPDRIHTHRTRMFPRRSDEISGQGSLYWVIGGAIRCRQPILELKAGTDEDGRGYCDIVMAEDVVHTRAQPRRPFQGWRYLEPGDAPPDLNLEVVSAEGDPALAQELSDLGLL
ncbi:MAG: DUF1489 domain-containing protein [Hyphomicrobiaceae bacterium]|nr:DUF1489 domain-containing protein [Hyphomicrobiaceae bacterium]MCC0023620.1 DUF1489 domain-containing protein [Hyphomicrobiaceae bacterium]